MNSISCKVIGMLFIAISLITVSSCKRDSPKDSSLALLSFSPEQGSEGGAVVLKGRNFASNKESNLVKFNGLEAQVTEATADGTSLTVIVPENASTGKITIKVGENEAVSSKDFTVNPLAPVISSFTPETGAAGTVIAVTGRNFIAPVKVFFGEIEATVVEVISKTSLNVTVPENVITGKIKVSSNNLEGLSGTDFKGVVVAGTITPNEASHGDTVEIAGINFDRLPENNIVKFGTHVAEVLEATPTLLKVKLPNTTSNGNVSITVGEVTSQTTNRFTLISKIIDFHPKHGAPGTSVTITGKSFSTSPTVVFRGFTCDVTESTPTSITFTIPVERGLIDSYIEVRSRNNDLRTSSMFELTDTWKWVQTNYVEFEQSYSANCVYNNKIYQFSGSERNGEVSNAVNVFDPATNTWSQVNTTPAEIAGGRYGTAIVHNNKMYVGNFQYVNNPYWYEYDPAVSGEAAWKRMADFPLANAYGSIGLNLQGKIIVAFGNRNNEFYELNPIANNGTGEWVSVHQAPGVSRDKAFSFNINGVTYYGGGFNSSSLTDFYKLDVAANYTSTAMGNLPLGISSFPAFAYNGKGYVLRQRRLHIYTPETDTWTTGRVDDNLENADVRIVQVINNKIYGTDYTGKVFEYTPNR